MFRVTRESAIFKVIQRAKPEEATVTALNPVPGLYRIPAIEITKSIFFFFFFGWEIELMGGQVGHPKAGNVHYTNLKN